MSSAWHGRDWASGWPLREASESSSSTPPPTTSCSTSTSRPPSLRNCKVRSPVLVDSFPALFTTERWGAGAVICLERGADLHTAQLMPLPLASVKSRLALPFWCWLTRVVPGSPGQRAVKWVCLCWFTRQNT